MSGVVIELGAGSARVGFARIAVAPAAGGAIRVGTMTLEPLSFADRSRLVADARAAGATSGLGAAVLARAAGGRGMDQATDASILEALALHLAGARDASDPLPGFASALVAVTCGAGWTPASTADAPADLVDRLADAILAAVPASEDEGGWTRVVFAAGTPAPHAGADDPDPAAVRDALVADLLRREAEGLTREAVDLAKRTARPERVLPDPSPSSRAEGPAGPRSADDPPAQDAASVIRPPSARSAEDDGAPGTGGLHDIGRHAAVVGDADAGPSTIYGASFPGFPQPIAAGPPWPGSPTPPRAATASTPHDPPRRPMAAVGASAPGSCSVLGEWAPYTPGSAVGHGFARSTVPLGTGLPAAGRPVDLAVERDHLSVLALGEALSEALGAALGEECDLRGLEEA